MLVARKVKMRVLSRVPRVLAIWCICRRRMDVEASGMMGPGAGTGADGGQAWRFLYL